MEFLGILLATYVAAVAETALGRRSRSFVSRRALLPLVVIVATGHVWSPSPWRVVQMALVGLAFDFNRGGHAGVGMVSFAPVAFAIWADCAACCGGWNRSSNAGLRAARGRDAPPCCASGISLVRRECIDPPWSHACPGRGRKRLYRRGQPAGVDARRVARPMQRLHPATSHRQRSRPWLLFMPAAGTINRKAEQPNVQRRSYHLRFATSRRPRPTRPWPIRVADAAFADLLRRCPGACVCPGRAAGIDTGAGFRAAAARPLEKSRPLAGVRGRIVSREGSCWRPIGGLPRWPCIIDARRSAKRTLAAATGAGPRQRR